MNNQDYLILTTSADELAYAAEHIITDISAWRKKLDKSTNVSRAEKEVVLKQYATLLTEISRLSKDISLFKEYIQSKNMSECVNIRRDLYSRLRICQSLYASLMTCLNWQSPAVKTSLLSRNGIEREAVKADWNDYKRDRSSDTFMLEQLYNRQIFDIKPGKNYALNICNSGMAAFTAILYFLLCEGIIKKKVFASSHIYVESKMLLKQFLKKQLVIWAHNDTQALVKEICTEQPEVVFIEPISNTNTLRLFDIQELISEVAKTYTKELYFVVDVTCSFGFTSFVNSLNLPKNIKLFLHGSILKAPQLGLERVNAGFIQSFNLGVKTKKVLDYRTLSGTNIQDIATNLIPVTTGKFLQFRMKTIEENAIALASTMADLDTSQELIQEVVYPGLSNHPDHDLSKKIGFCGFFFNIKLIKKYNKDTFFEMYTKEVIALARERGCDIVHGASFGFNMTSIYYSVGWDEPDNHYIRISPGTETKYETDIISTVLRDAFIRFKQTLPVT